MADNESEAPDTPKSRMERRAPIASAAFAGLAVIVSVTSAGYTYSKDKSGAVAILADRKAVDLDNRRSAVLHMILSDQKQAVQVRELVGQYRNHTMLKVALRISPTDDLTEQEVYTLLLELAKQGQVALASSGWVVRRSIEADLFAAMRKDFDDRTKGAQMHEAISAIVFRLSSGCASQEVLTNDIRERTGLSEQDLSRVFNDMLTQQMLFIEDGKLCARVTR